VLRHCLPNHRKVSDLQSSEGFVYVIGAHVQRALLLRTAGIIYRLTAPDGARAKLSPGPGGQLALFRAGWPFTKILQDPQCGMMNRRDAHCPGVTQPHSTAPVRIHQFSSE
jgi:hypothetical protein